MILDEEIGPAEIRESVEKLSDDERAVLENIAVIVNRWDPENCHTFGRELSSYLFEIWDIFTIVRNGGTEEDLDKYLEDYIEDDDFIRVELAQRKTLMKEALRWLSKDIMKYKNIKHPGIIWSKLTLDECIDTVVTTEPSYWREMKYGSTENQRLFHIVREVISQWDPNGIFAPWERDKYDLEVGSIAYLLKVLPSMTDDDLATIINRVLSYYCDLAKSLSSCLPYAQKILTLLMASDNLDTTSTLLADPIQIQCPSCKKQVNLKLNSYINCECGAAGHFMWRDNSKRCTDVREL